MKQLIHPLQGREIIFIEVWKNIPGYEGIYQASNCGRIKSLDMVIRAGHGTRKKTGFILKQNMSKQGYYTISLCRCLCKTCSVHRLIAMAFIPNPENKPCVNHINGIKSDNRIENLEWVTLKENVQHAIRTGLKKPKKGISNGRSKLNEQQILDIRKTYANGGTSEPILSRVYNVSKATIHRVVSNQSWKHV